MKLLKYKTNFIQIVPEMNKPSIYFLYWDLKFEFIHKIRPKNRVQKYTKQNFGPYEDSIWALNYNQDTFS